MPAILFIVLLATVPLTEVYLFIRIGGAIGALPTVGLVVFTAVLGVTLLRRQGLQALARVRRSLDAGELPALELVEGVILLLAGALLLTPGFFTDAVGFGLLVPRLRRRLGLAVLTRVVVVQGRPPRPGSGGGPRTLEGEFWREDEGTGRRRPPSS